MNTHLHVLTTYTNPQGYASRTRLHRDFIKHMAQFAQITVWTIEGIYPGQTYQVTEANHPNHVQVELEHQLWYKENLLNVLASRLPDDGQPIAWIDADVYFSHPQWVKHALSKLETTDVIQLFSIAQDLDPDYGVVPFSQMRSMLSCVIETVERVASPITGYSRTAGHCGYAWAIRREFFEAIGGFFDYGIVGSGDFIMAASFLQSIHEAIPKDAPPAYRESILAYGAQVAQLSPRIGYIPGLLLHSWHGKKAKRGYQWRNQLLAKHAFDPHTDLVRDTQGLLQLTDPVGREAFHQDLTRYFASRDEDGRTV